MTKITTVDEFLGELETILVEIKKVNPRWYSMNSRELEILRKNIRIEAVQQKLVIAEEMRVTGPASTTTTIDPSPSTIFVGDEGEIS